MLHNPFFTCMVMRTSGRIVWIMECGMLWRKRFQDQLETSIPPPPFWAHRASCLCSLLNSSLCCIIFFWDNGISLQIQMYKLYSEIFVFSIYLFLIILLQFLNLHYDQNTKLFIARVCTVPVCSSNHDICCTTPFLLAWWRELQEEFYELWNVACFEERDF